MEDRNDCACGDCNEYVSSYNDPWLTHDECKAMGDVARARILGVVAGMQVKRDRPLTVVIIKP